jgi:hypothetical protein
VTLQPLVTVTLKIGDRVLCISEVHFQPAQDTATYFQSDSYQRL